MKIDVGDVAKLANLPLSNEEKNKFEEQISSILEYIEKLNEVDTKGIKPTSQVTGLENVVRNDETEPSFSQEEALSNTSTKHNGLFKVHAILEG